MGSAARENGPAVGLATFSEFPHLSEDDRLLARALDRLGVAAVPVMWRDPGFDPASVDMLVMRSTWDYFRDPVAFLEWVDRCGASTEVWNRPGVIRWNSDKRYLSELNRTGVPTVPTAWVTRSETVDLSSVIDSRGWRRIVIKPNISGNAWLTATFDPTQIKEAEAHLRAVLERGDAMVQPLVETAVREGELSLVFLDGEYSHAAQYPSRFGPAPEPHRLRKADADSRALRTGYQCLAAVPDRTLYARVDLLPNGEGEWLVGELELIEPELAFRSEPSAAERMAGAIQARLDRSTRASG